MKNIFLFLIFILSFYFAHAQSVQQIRKSYQLALNDSKVADELHVQLKKQNSSDPLIQAYFACMDAVKAKHAKSPVSKYKLMQTFDNKMSAVISKSPDEIEIRYLRYTIFNNTPSFLGYGHYLKEDKNVIVELFLKKKFDDKDNATIRSIYDYMVSAKSLTSEEKKKMEAIINKK